jgi:hypothetical protein
MTTHELMFYFGLGGFLIGAVVAFFAADRHAARLAARLTETIKSLAEELVHKEHVLRCRENGGSYVGEDGYTYTLVHGETEGVKFHRCLSISKGKGNNSKKHETI